MSTIYDLTGDILRLYEIAEDPEVDEQALLCAIEEVTGDYKDKADSYAKVISQLKADAEALKTEENRIATRKRTCLNSADRIKQALEESMKVTGMTKFKTQLFSFGIQNNPPSVVIDNPEAVPAEYIVPQEPKYDKAAIKDALKSGEQCDWAHLEVSDGLRIR